MFDNAILEPFDGICFVTDANGVITAVGPANWDGFAAENDAASLTTAKVVGRKLLDFVAGEEVRDQIAKVLDGMAAGDYERWVMPYRCDAPGIKRNMRLCISPILAAGKFRGFLFQSILLSAEDRPPIDLFDFAALAEYAKSDAHLPILTMCAYCQRVHDAAHTSEQWVEAEQYYSAGGTSQVRLSHGICEACLEKAVLGES